MYVGASRKNQHKKGNKTIARVEQYGFLYVVDIVPVRKYIYISLLLSLSFIFFSFFFLEIYLSRRIRSFFFFIVEFFSISSFFSICIASRYGLLSSPFYMIIECVAGFPQYISPTHPRLLSPKNCAIHSSFYY